MIYGHCPALTGFDNDHDSRFGKNIKMKAKADNGARLTSQVFITDGHTNRGRHTPTVTSHDSDDSETLWDLSLLPGGSRDSPRTDTSDTEISSQKTA